MKHFHNAALDYMWQREAQTSKNWRIRLYVLMEVPGGHVYGASVLPALDRLYSQL